MCIVEKEVDQKETSEEVMFIVRNHVKENELKVCFPISKKRAGNVEKAKKVFLCVASYFEKKVAESLVLYQKKGINENGKEEYSKIAECVINNGNREIVEPIFEAIIS